LSEDVVKRLTIQYHLKRRYINIRNEYVCMYLRLLAKHGMSKRE